MVRLLRLFIRSRDMQAAAPLARKPSDHQKEWGISPTPCKGAALLSKPRTDRIRRYAWFQQLARCFAGPPLFVCLNLPQRKPWFCTVAGRLSKMPLPKGDGSNALPAGNSRTQSLRSASLHPDLGFMPIDTRPHFQQGFCYSDPSKSPPPPPTREPHPQ